MINARGETVGAKPAFCDAFRSRRCMILVDGFYEWQAIPGAKRKVPHAVRMTGGTPFVLAGLWESWNAKGAVEAVETCTIVTTAANALLAPIHDRMPVILDPSAYGVWLDPTTPSAVASAMLRPYDGPGLCAYPVSTYVNSPAHGDAQCLEPVAA
jgi:putative SOS response-associated peptidase YedK